MAELAFAGTLTERLREGAGADIIIVLSAARATTAGACGARRQGLHDRT
jgi:hypothetical protein